MLAQTGVVPIQKAVYVLHQMSEDEKIQEMARVREKALLDEATAMSGAKREGLVEVAKNLLGMGDSIEKIASVTGLTLEEIEHLK